MSRPARSDDRGFSLAELMVAMGIMVVFMTIATGAMVMIFGSSQRTEATTRTSQQINGSFMWLDGHLRYADYLSDAGTGGRSVMFSAPDPAAPSAAPVCFQLRVDQTARQLQWRQGATGAWQALASDLVVTGVPAPLTVVRPGATRPSGVAGDIAKRSELWLSITAQQGDTGRGGQAQSNAAFPALNSANAGPGAQGACQGVTSP